MVTKSYNTLEGLPFDVEGITKISFYSHVLLAYTINTFMERKRANLFKILATLRKCFGFSGNTQKVFRKPSNIRPDINTSGYNENG